MVRALIVCVVAAALFVVPAVASAARWKGRTDQGRVVTVRTGADGVVNRVLVRWKARCRDVTRTGRTVFSPPFDQTGTTEFVDGGTSRSSLGNGVRSRDTVSVRGSLGGDGRWRGSFRFRSVLRKDGKVVDRCRVREIGWRARPR